MKQPHKQLFRFNVNNNTYTHIETGKVLTKEFFMEQELVRIKEETLDLTNIISDK